MSVSELQAQIEDLKAQLEAARASNKKAPRGKIAEMSAEVVDSNPYSRLLALKRMGIGAWPNSACLFPEF